MQLKKPAPLAQQRIQICSPSSHKSPRHNSTSWNIPLHPYIDHCNWNCFSISKAFLQLEITINPWSYPKYVFGSLAEDSIYVIHLGMYLYLSILLSALESIYPSIYLAIKLWMTFVASSSLSGQDFPMPPSLSWTLHLSEMPCISSCHHGGHHILCEALGKTGGDTIFGASSFFRIFRCMERLMFGAVGEIHKIFLAEIFGESFLSSDIAPDFSIQSTEKWVRCVFQSSWFVKWWDVKQNAFSERNTKY